MKLENTILRAPWWAWRIFAILYCTISSLILLSDFYWNEPIEQLFSFVPEFMSTPFMVLSIVSWAFIVIFSSQFYFYVFDCCVWTLICLSNTEVLIGVFFCFSRFALCCSFMFLHERTKSIVILILFISTLIDKYRYVVSFSFDQPMDYCAFILLIAAFLLLFWIYVKFCPFVHEGESEDGEEKLVLDSAEFTERDAEIIRRILAGEKYDTIAVDLDIALQTVKQRCAVLFRKLDVSDRYSFMSQYARKIVIRK